MGKKITSLVVLLAAMLLSLPTQAQMQKAKRVSDGKAATEMRTLQKALKVDRAAIEQQQKAFITKAMESGDPAVMELVSNWNWGAHAPQQFVSTSGQSQFVSMNVAGEVKTAGVVRTKKSAPRRTLVTPPAGVEAETWYTASGVFKVYGNGGWVDYTSNMSTVKVIVDGTDIYLAGLSYWAPDAYIKGTISGTTVTFASGQQIDEDPDYPEYIVGSETGEEVTENIVFTYDAAEGTLKAVTPLVMGAIAPNSTSIYEYWQYPEFSKTEPEGPSMELIELPAGAEVKNWYVTGTTNSGDIPATANIAFVDDEVYIKGLFTQLPNAWVKGTKTGNSVAFPKLQYLGAYGQYNIWTWTGTAPDASGSYYILDEVTFTYDETAQTLTLDDDQAYVATADHTRWYALDYYTELSLSANEPVVENIKVPYTSDLTKQAEFKKWTVLDNNADGYTWKWSSTYGTYYGYNMSRAADDYLILPVELEANKNYNVTVSAASYSPTYPETFEVKVGKAATVEGLNLTAISSTTVASKDAIDYEGDFTTDGDAGIWYVAIHAISDANMWNLIVESFTIEVGPEPTAPAAVSNLAAVAGDKGALEVRLSFTTPTQAIDGSALRGTEDIDIYRDDVLVKTIKSVGLGNDVTWKDTDVEDGKIYTYYVQATNKSGAGAKSGKVSVLVGQDTPDDIENVQVTGMPTSNSVSFAWDAVKGINGGYIDVANAQYSVTTVEIEEVEIIPGWTYEMPVEGVTLGTVTGETAATVNFAGLDEGELGIQYFGVKAKVGAKETDPTSWLAYVYTGAPYELPIAESFEGQSTHYLWDYNEVTGLYVSADASDNDGVALALTAAEAGTVMFESFKLNTKAAANPTLLFDAKKGTSATDKILVYCLAPDGTKTAKVITLTDEYQTFKVTIPEKFAKERWAKIGFNANLEKGTNILLDNIKVVDLYEYDLSMSVKAPASIKAGEAATITATVKNEGENAASGYTVIIKAGEEELLNTTVNEALAPFTTKEFTAELATTIFDDAADVTITATVEYLNDLNEDNNAADAIVSIKESTAAPVIAVTAEATDGGVLVGWTAPDLDGASTEEITDDVESYEEFDNGGLGEDNLDEHYGQIGEWTVYDGNREFGYGFNGITVPHLGEPNAWLVMNVSSAQLSQDLSEAQPAYSGNQYFISTCVAESTPIADTDHWLISPELPGTAQHISFMARELTDQYGEESFQIWYSTTDNKIESFQQHEFGFGLVVLDTWDKFEYDLPEGTKYFAIRHTSNDIFGLCIDDIQFTAGAAPLVIDHFNIYLDGEAVATAAADAVTATLNNVAAGEHTVAVSVVYTNGTESKPVATTVSVVTGIDSITVITQPVDVYSLDGKLVRKQTTAFDGLKGVYIVNGKKVILQ